MTNQMGNSVIVYTKQTYRRTSIRLIKANPGWFGQPNIKIESAGKAQLLLEGVNSEESETEFYFFLEHEEYNEKSTIGFQVNWPNVRIQEIICEGTFVPFQLFADECHFEVDINGFRGRSKTLDIHSHFVEPGLSIRIEQNHMSRNAGQYKQIAWPQTQINAVAHYIFASREVVKALHLPSDLALGDLGYIALMGFETNNPDHGDYPPHWHLIFRWPHFAGSQAPHFYLDSNGKNTHNIVTVDGIPRVQCVYGTEDWCMLKDYFGNELFAVKVCSDGGIAITRPEHPVYRLLPYNSETGVTVLEQDEPVGSIQVENDTTAGLMTIRWTMNREQGAISSLNCSSQETVTYHPLIGNVIEVTHDSL